MAHTLKRLLVAIAIGFSGFTASANNIDNWPIPIAAKGCEFEWRGPSEYFEIARSLGAGVFPEIGFSRHDYGFRPMSYTPICGSFCISTTARKQFHAFFPLKAGKTIEIAHGNINVVLEVKSLTRLATSPDFKSFEVLTTVKLGENVHSKYTSWWSDEAGWILGYKDETFEKWVVAVNCSTPLLG